MMEPIEQEATAAQASPRGWPMTGAALLLGAMLGAAWFAVNTSALPRAGQAPVAEATERVVSAAAEIPRQGDIAKLLEVEPAAAPARPEPGADEMLVCGQVMPRAALADDRIGQTLQETGAAQAIVQFAQQQLADDDHARAVGLALRIQADANLHPDGYAACRESDNDCFQRAAGAHAGRVAPLLAELATLAAATTDARAFTLAREQCQLLAHDAPPPPHCQVLTARRLVALERDNALAWLALADEEPAAIDEAMYQAAIAPRWDDHASAARRFVERVDAQGGLRSLVLVQSLLMTATPQTILPQQMLSKHCSANALGADANRRLQCEQLAQGLRAHSRSLSGLSAAAQIAKVLGRSDAEAWRDEARLLAHVQHSRADDVQAQEADTRDCSDGLPRALLLRSAREGEVAAARALLRESGLSEAQWREKLAASDEAARKLASASPAAAADPAAPVRQRRPLEGAGEAGTGGSP